MEELRLSKNRFFFGNGKEDSVKETQEGCLSRSINDFFECFGFKKVAFSAAKRLFRHAELNHFDAQGNAVMVDVSKKALTARTATAKGHIRVSREVMAAIQGGTAAKGDVLGVARVAGIMAAKRTSDLIPLCHPLALSHAAVDFTILEEERAVQAECTVKLSGQTGVEMEALTGVTAALLTIYDMCKAIDKGMELSGICLVHKEGGKSGVYDREG